jgi:hypothetical protein
MEPQPTRRKSPSRNQTSPGDKAKIKDVIDLIRQGRVSEDDGKKLCGALIDRITAHLVLVPCHMTKKDREWLIAYGAEPLKPLGNYKPPPAANLKIRGVIDILRKGNASEDDVEKLRFTILDWLTILQSRKPSGFKSSG